MADREIPKFDPTPQQLSEAMKILAQYTSFICLEGDCLVASVIPGKTIVDDDKLKLADLWWELKSSGNGQYFCREFADH